MTTTLGLLAGAGWQLLSVACLRRLLRAWLRPRPSTRAVVGWLLLKISLVGLLAAWLAAAPAPFLAWFGIGFTGAMAAVVGWSLQRPQETA